MSDLISRSALIEHIKDVPTWIAYDKNPRKYPVGMYDPEDVIGSIENAPTIEPYGTWIPCSERLPKCNGRYLVWRPHYYGGDRGGANVCYFDGQNTWHDADGVDFTRTLNKGDVIAWMPLPEPYKEEK